MNHPFIDGNKRTAFAVCDGFLRINGYFIDCESIDAYTSIMGMLETNSFCFVNLCNWLEKVVKPKHRA